MREFEIGDKVYHPDFGEGIIRSIAITSTLMEDIVKKEK